MKNNITFLEISSWRGSFGGEHYYGELQFKLTQNSYEHHKLQKQLTQKEADILNKKDKSWDHYGRYKKDELSDRFNTEQEIIDLALKTWKNINKESNILLKCDCARRSCAEILDGPKEIMEKGNNFFKEFEKCGGYEGDYDKASKLDDKFQKLIFN